MFANGPGNRDQPQVESYLRQKMVRDATLLNTQHYKIRINSKVEQFKKWSCALSYSSAIEKGAFGSPSTKVADFTYLYICINY